MSSGFPDPMVDAPFYGLYAQATLWLLKFPVHSGIGPGQADRVAKTGPQVESPNSCSISRWKWNPSVQRHQEPT